MSQSMDNFTCSSEHFEPPIAIAPLVQENEESNDTGNPIKPVDKTDSPSKKKGKIYVEALWTSWSIGIFCRTGLPNNRPIFIVKYLGVNFHWKLVLEF